MPLGAVFFIGGAGDAVDPTAAYFFVLTFSGPPTEEEIAAFSALPGVHLAAREGWEIVLRIDPRENATEAFEACLARHEGRLLEYGTIASVDRSQGDAPSAQTIPPSRALVLLAREAQNRRRAGALEQGAGGDRWLAGLAEALRDTPCWSVAAGSPDRTAALIRELFLGPPRPRKTAG
ncbi:MAG: hypothetical protein Q9Q13_03395 [Acidobacteriota bacterium]|nr:hypothetical protein [Acidobacteriota bacterium]